jgi:hypothetical protein
MEHGAGTKAHSPSDPAHPTTAAIVCSTIYANLLLLLSLAVPDNHMLVTRVVRSTEARRFSIAWSVIAIILTATACRNEVASLGSPEHRLLLRIANLHAFARLYGIVRWFHPSDAAATADWDRLAIEGTRRVIDAKDRDALRTRLSELFGSIAPTMRIIDTEARGQFPEDASLHPASIADRRIFKCARGAMKCLSAR